MKFKIGRTQITIEPVPPEIGVQYHQKDRDERDLIEYVVPQEIVNGVVKYMEFYKDPSLRTQLDQMTITEFNKYFRKGA